MHRKVEDYYFNSTMVRLKDKDGVIDKAAFLYFNSTMVRLKAFLLSVWSLK